VKKFSVVLLTIILIASCKGGGAPSPESIIIDLGLEVPQQFVGLDIAQFSLRGTLAKEGVSQPDVTGEYSEGRYIFDFGGIEAGTYWFNLGVDYVNESGVITVAVVSKEAELQPGVNELNLTAEDFIIGGGDDDGDNVLNADEVVSGLDPFLSDSDGDSVSDSEDVFPADSNEWKDTDGDGTGDNADPDIDGDGLTNEEETAIGTNAFSPDSDNDGVDDLIDNCKLTLNPSQADTDGDGSGDACDDDSDDDSLSDELEKSIGTNPLKPDTDDDGVADNLEIDNGTNPTLPDTDGDGYNDGNDTFPLDPAEWLDTDNDTIGDNSDNCLEVPNPDQNNTDEELSLAKLGYEVDADGLGNACDNDIDGNGLPVVFVNGEVEDDEGLGTFNDPIKSLKRGILVAYERGEDVYVAAGSYNLAEVVFLNGVNLYGGFYGGNFTKLPSATEHTEKYPFLVDECVDLTCVRHVKEDNSYHMTKLYNDSSPITLDLKEGQGTFIIEGFFFENNFAAKEPIL